MAKLGIDISTFQGNIDLEALKDKIDFVIIRVGFGVSGTIDNKFKRNANLCKTLGIPFGFYWYSYALNEEGAEAEAKAFLKAIEPYKNDYSYGCWFDMEDADGYKARKGMPTNAMLRKICAKFCSIVEEAGYYVGIYASQSWFKNQLNGSELNRYDKWLAQWPTSGGVQKGLATNPDSKAGVNLWQFTSMAQIEGYSGRLDASYAYRDYPGIIAGMRAPTVEEPVPEEKEPETIVEEPAAAPAYEVYTVVKGDNLTKIAKKYGTTWNRIYQDNRDTIKDPRVIYVGQEIKIYK